MLVAVRNLKTGPTVFTVPGEDISFEWTGMGDPSGEDVQEVPSDLLKNSRFRRAVQAGILGVIEDAAEAQESLDAQVAAMREREDESKASAIGAIDHAVENDLVSLPCQGPGGRGTGECGTPVVVRDGKAGEAPILCPLHSGMAAEFSLTQTGQMIETEDSLVPEQKWVRTVITDRERH